MRIFEFPLVRVCICFLLGIITAHYTAISLNFCMAMFGIAILFFLFSYFQSAKLFTQPIFFAPSLYFLFFSIGITALQLQNPSNKRSHYTQLQDHFDKPHYIEICIQEKLKSSAKNDRYTAIVSKINNKRYQGKIILNIAKTNKETNFSTGTTLRILEQLVKNFKPNNPNQFDYGSYLETKGIFAQIYTEISHLKKSTIVKRDIWYYADHYRYTIERNLAQSGFHNEELAVIMALILGQQQDISPEVLRDYQFAGAVHILSVSGLHVGFLLLFIGFLLQPIPNTKIGNSIKIIITLLSLWSFALIAGFSPSVVRSATMFSFIAIGKFINRETNSFHTTIVSLFIILLIEPNFLFDIGFQLSYLAVFSILWLQPILQRIWQPKNSIINYFWDILVISFAAQIGTLPLSLYYFNQFPGLFFITNLVLIPLLGFVIMPLGTLLIVFAFLNCIPIILTEVVERSIAIMNCFISWIASMENFICKEIPMNQSLLVASYLTIVLWILWIQKPSFRKLAFALGSVIVLQSLYFFIRWNEQFNNEFIVFNTKNKSIFAEKKGQEIQLLTNDTLATTSFEHKMLQNYAIANFSSLKKAQNTSNHRYFNHKKILIIDHSAVYSKADKADVLILSHSPKINLERLFTHFKPNIVIADASNYKSYVNLWKASCVKNKIPFHSTYEKGFYKL